MPFALRRLSIILHHLQFGSPLNLYSKPCPEPVEGPKPFSKPLLSILLITYPLEPAGNFPLNHLMINNIPYQIKFIFILSSFNFYHDYFRNFILK